MTLIKLIPEDHIEELEKDEHEKFHKMLDSQAESKSKSWEAKEQWLAVFARALSPMIACKQAGVPNGTYRRWRTTDPRFCRALNRIIEEAHDELIGTAYARATGYLQEDQETESGYQEDATGRPIRHGVSDRLAIALVNANQKTRTEKRYQRRRLHLILSILNETRNLAWRFSAAAFDRIGTPVAEVGSVKFSDPVVAEPGALLDGTCPRLVPNHSKGKFELRPFGRIAVVGETHLFLFMLVIAHM